MKNDELDFSSIYEWIENGGDNSVVEDNEDFTPNPKLLKKYAPDLFKEVFMNKSGSLAPISRVLEKLSQTYEPEIIPFDPTFCHMFPNSVEQAVASLTETMSEDYIHYPEDIVIATFNHKGKPVQQGIWRDKIIHPKNANKRVIAGRTYASNASHLICVDQFLEAGMTSELQLMIVAYNTQHPDYVDASLIVDVTEGYEPYKNAYLFAQDRTRFPELTDSFSLRLLMKDLLPGAFWGNSEIPELA